MVDKIDLDFGVIDRGRGESDSGLLLFFLLVDETDTPVVWRLLGLWLDSLCKSLGLLKLFLLLLHGPVLACDS